MDICSYALCQLYFYPLIHMDFQGNIGKMGDNGGLLWSFFFFFFCNGKCEYTISVGERVNPAGLTTWSLWQEGGGEQYAFSLCNFYDLFQPLSACDTPTSTLWRTERSHTRITSCYCIFRKIIMWQQPIISIPKRFFSSARHA